MHSTFQFLMNYEDRDLPVLTEYEIKKSWIIEEAVRLMIAAPEQEAITSQNFEQSLLLYMEGLEDRWTSMSAEEHEKVEAYEREKAKYAEIAEDLNSEIESEYFGHHGDENNWSQSEVAIFKNGMIAPMCEIDDWRGRGWTYYQFLKIEREKRWEEALRTALQCVAYDFDVPGLIHFNFGREKTDTERKLEAMSSSEIIEALEYYAPRFMSKRLLEYLAVVISRSRGKETGDVNIGDMINMIYPQDYDMPMDPSKALTLINKEKGEPNWMGDYRLRQALQVYQSWQSARFVPFTNDIENPYYNYRCYDLRDWSPDYDMSQGYISSDTKMTPRRADDFIEDNSVIVLVDVHT